jgi:hypothetical protein
LGGHPSKYKLGPTLLDFGDQMGTARSNVARRRSSTVHLPPINYVGANFIHLLQLF